MHLRRFLFSCALLVGAVFLFSFLPGLSRLIVSDVPQPQELPLPKAYHSIAVMDIRTEPLQSQTDMPQGKGGRLEGSLVAEAFVAGIMLRASPCHDANGNTLQSGAYYRALFHAYVPEAGMG